MDNMNNLNWFYPETETECLDLLKNGYRPHGGGTFLVKTSLNIKGLFDLSAVKSLKNTDNHDGLFKLGAALTYAEAAAFLEKELPGNIFSAALSRAAATPLRNRITIGGSICAAPKWSDIIAPLYSSGTAVLIAGEKQPVDFTDFMQDRNLKKNSLVTALLLPANSLKGSTYRFTITGFDYPLFHIALSRRGDEDFSCAISGYTGGVKVYRGNIKSIMTVAEPQFMFNDERGLSGSYIKNRALTELNRLLLKEGATDE